MKRWIFILFIGLINEANAKLKDASTGEEERSAAPIQISAEELPEESKTDVSSSSNESVVRPPHDVENTASSSLLGRNETSASPGADLRVLDSKYLDSSVSFPVREMSWWERWWTAAKEWF